MSTFPELKDFISNIKVENLVEERKIILDSLVDFIQQKIDHKNQINLNFICTHNSRRSHFAQVWAQTMAHHFGIEKVFCYSGGTEATALCPAVIATLQKTGFRIEKLSIGQNPIYSIKYAENTPPIIGFSKTWHNLFNPKNSFAAVMTCSQADTDCPFITGAERRIPITFEDPKKFDNTPQESKKYNERSIQIATELFYVFSKIQIK